MYHSCDTILIRLLDIKAWSTLIDFDSIFILIVFYKLYGIAFGIKKFIIVEEEN